MILRIAACLAASYLIIAPAVAETSCPSAQGIADLMRTNERLDIYKARELAQCVKELREAVVSARTANTVAWSVGAHPMRFLEQIPAFDHTHSTCDDVPNVLRAVHLQTRILLAGGEQHIEQAEVGLKALMKHFIKADAWQVFFSDKAAWRRLVEQKSTIQFALRCLTNVKPLLEKPFDAKLAERAMQWFSEQCGRSVRGANDRKFEDYPECTMKTVSEEFKAHYGVELTESHAYVLGWLRRRHLEGGPAVVSLLQTTALMFAKDLAAGEQVTIR
ncbi:MAG: hypothetical protein KBE09_05045 [Candidatus Pacebacteria bacterium]|nr:hypothetical protein [Candidatus Paceibacterota bacterium]